MAGPGRPRVGRAARTDPGSTAGYWEQSKQPLEILLLVLPLVALYEAGLLWALRLEGGILTNRAHEGLLRIFDALDIDAQRLSLPALSLPALGLLFVLLSWQLLSRRPWAVRLGTVGLMFAESACAAVPLLVLSQVLARAMAVGLPDAASQVDALPMFGKITVAIGAGLYEEFVFRMVLILFLHTLFVDLMRLPQLVGTIAAVAVAAVLFAIYHPLADGAGHLSMRRLAFFLCAGAWFGTLYVLRGFGIAVGAHAAYDIAVVALLGE